MTDAQILMYACEQMTMALNYVKTPKVYRVEFVSESRHVKEMHWTEGKAMIKVNGTVVFKEEYRQTDEIEQRIQMVPEEAAVRRLLLLVLQSGLAKGIEMTPDIPDGILQQKEIQS